MLNTTKLENIIEKFGGNPDELKTNLESERLDLLMDMEATGGGTVVSGTVVLTSNGLHNVSKYANADVKVPTVEAEGNIDINKNGSYNISEYATANVNVEGQKVEGSINITANGTYDVSEYASASVQVGETTVTKGFIVNQWDDNGRATDVTVVGLTTLPMYYFERYNEAEADALAKALEKVSSADITTVSTQSFYLSPVKTIDFPNLTSVGQASFKNCYSLKTIDISKVTSIKKQGFYNCKVLLAEKLNENLTTLGEQAFYTCSKITIKEIPSGITSISNSAFNGCSSITELTLLGDVTSIGSSAFQNTKIAKLVLPNVTSVPTAGNTYFIGSTPIANGTGYIYVPDTLVDAFKSAEYWSTYANQIKGISEM